MRISGITVRNFRSVRNADAVRIEPLQAFVGENNAGKSNFLRAIKCFLSPGSGGMEASDFCDPKVPAVIECEFSELNAYERKRLKQYLLGDKVILKKELEAIIDPDREKTTVKATYHGYRAEPAQIHLSLTKILEKYGDRPKWADIAKEEGLPEYFLEEGKSNKAIYSKALERYLIENEIEYDEPRLGETQL